VRRKAGCIVATLIFTLVIGFQSYAAATDGNSGNGLTAATQDQGEWRQDDMGWWYQWPDGTWVANEWMQYGGNWYYFAADGYMLTGWRQFSSGWYEFNAKGACLNPRAAAPYSGWFIVDPTSSALSTMISTGAAVYYNGNWWCSPEFLQEMQDLQDRDYVPVERSNKLQPGVIY